MTNRLFLALACVLFIVRLPSLVEPMGADQGLYAYVGERILGGGVPYRDAWDQKPPAVHVTYAVMRAVWPHDSAVAAADLLIAVVVAWLLHGLGSALVARTTGQAAALLFLFLSNPSFLRLSGVSVRAQCETFMAAAVAAALLMIVRLPIGRKPDTTGRVRPKPAATEVRWKAKAARPDATETTRVLAAGVLFGIAFTFKYNSAVYALVGLFALWLWRRLSLRAFIAVSAGFGIPVVVVLAWFLLRGALVDLYDATIGYNLMYSGQTYAGPLDAIRYLLTFPVRHSRVDGLWLVGCTGCAVLLVASVWNRTRLLAVAWVGAACLSIAINGSRDLPQYFIQAAPALSLAAAWGGAVLWSWPRGQHSGLRRRIVTVIAVAIVSVGVWRVNDFQKLAGNTWHDTRYVFGLSPREEHLARYGETGVRKYSALAVERLAEYLETHSKERDPVYIFGFSCGAYVKAERVSASRFFWSRPVIAGFNEGVPGYGAAGVLADLQRRPPAIVALQEIDWLEDVDNSAHYFTTHPLLGPWLRANYARTDGPEGFETWARVGTP